MALNRTKVYDEENRLRRATGTNLQVDYEYDPEGRRRAKTVIKPEKTVKTIYVSDGVEEIEERDGNNTLLRRYAYGSGIDDRVAMYDNVICTGGPCYYQTNHQGSTVALTNSSGQLLSAYGYGEYGNSSQDPQGNPFRYTGRRLDPETGLYYYRARYYSPKIGRFLQTDPIGTKDDLNLYAYVGNDPLNKTDPTGMYESHWLLRALVPGQVTFDNAMTAAENGNYGQTGALMGAMVVEQVLTVASFGASSAATPTVRTVETAVAGASELNASRGLSARMGGIVFHGHHPIPKVLGGPSDQALETLTAGLHGKFHSMLEKSLKKGGFDLPIGGKRGSTQAWSRYFSENPGSQKRAQDIVRQTSKAFDEKYGTDLAGATKRMCTSSRIAHETC